MSKPDVNFYDMKSSEVLSYKKLDGRGYSDTVKLSNVTGCRIEYCDIVGGSEDVADINLGGDHVIINSTLRPTGRFGMTIKGGAKNILIASCHFADGAGVDIDLGNWSEQSQERTTNVSIIHCTKDNNKPIKVRCLWADDPEVIDSNVKISRVHPILLYFFKLFKKLGV